MGSCGRQESKQGPWHTRQVVDVRLLMRAWRLEHGTDAWHKDAPRNVREQGQCVVLDNAREWCYPGTQTDSHVFYAKCRTLLLTRKTDACPPCSTPWSSDAHHSQPGQCRLNSSMQICAKSCLSWRLLAAFVATGQDSIRCLSDLGYCMYRRPKHMVQLLFHFAFPESLFILRTCQWVQYDSILFHHACTKKVGCTTLGRKAQAQCSRSS